MDPMAVFGAYATDFEKTYVDDDWSRLEKYFADDAVYHVTASEEMDWHMTGPKEILAGLKRSIDGFDRHCERTIGLRGAPVVEGNKISLDWRVGYRRHDSPELVLLGCSKATIEDGQIQELIDLFPDLDRDAYEAWVAKYGEGLEFTY